MIIRQKGILHNFAYFFIISLYVLLATLLFFANRTSFYYNISNTEKVSIG